MSKLINDNVPQILNLSPDRIRVCKDNKEFFALLRVKILENVNKIFDEKDKGKKQNALFDSLYDLEKVKTALGGSSLDFDAIEREKKVGGYEKKLVLEEVSSGEVLENVVMGAMKQVLGVDQVLKFAEQNDYPAMVLKRDGDKVIKKMGKGKESWDNAMSWVNLNEPYKSNFNDLIRAVENKDIWQEED